MRRRHLLALVPALPVVVLLAGGACNRGPGTPVSLALGLTFPQGLIDQATGMTLTVFDASLAKCDLATGHIDKLPPVDQTQIFPLGKTGCAKGDAWCTTIKLDKDGSNKMFSVVATKAGATIAEGCTSKLIDQDPLPVEIQAHRYSPPRCCGDGKLEPGEQCDSAMPGSCDGTPATACSGVAEDPVCFCDCTAKEILLSLDDAEAPLLKNGAAGTKTNLALAFGPGGASNPTMLRAVFENTDKSAVGGADINERFLREDLFPVTEPHPLGLQLRLPLFCNGVTSGASIPREQRAPALAAASSDTMALVYQSDEANGGQDFDVLLTAQTADGCTDVKPCTTNADCQTSCDTIAGTCKSSVQLNVTPGGCTDVHVAAGPSNSVLVTWTRKEGIFGRVWGADGSLMPPDSEIPIAPKGSASRVGGSPFGYRVVFQGNGSGDPDGIFFVNVDAAGKLSGATLVNTVTTGVQDQPDIAMLVDGSMLVAWHSGGDILFQRFDVKGKPVTDDQNAPLNTSGVGTDVDQQHPVVAGANGSFVVAWETVDAAGVGNITARFVGGSNGFGFNSVTGQNDEFPATDPAQPGDRRHAAVALGNFTVIGWEDRSLDHHGVFVRRFPPPILE
jgi:hypothetical protein